MLGHVDELSNLCSLTTQPLVVVATESAAATARAESGPNGRGGGRHKIVCLTRDGETLWHMLDLEAAQRAGQAGYTHPL